MTMLMADDLRHQVPSSAEMTENASAQVQSASAQSVGHRLIVHAREALAAGDELVAVLMLRMAYEAFDKSDRRGAV